MRKKYFLIFLLLFFLQFSFWPVLFSLKSTPFFLLAFLVVLSGQVSFRESFLWAIGSGMLMGYFSPWPPMTEIIIFSLIISGLFLLGKIFLWRRESFLLEGCLLIFSKFFFDGTKILLSKILVWLKYDYGSYSKNFVFWEYLLQAVLFVVVGLILFFYLRRRNGLSIRTDLRYYS